MLNWIGWNKTVYMYKNDKQCLIYNKIKPRIVNLNLKKTKIKANKQQKMNKWKKREDPWNMKETAILIAIGALGTVQKKSWTKDWRNRKSEEESKLNKPQYCKDHRKILKILSHSDSGERSPAKASVRRRRKQWWWCCCCFVFLLFKILFIDIVNKI